MSKKSAGILIYRLTNNLLELFLVHPGGPFFIKKDLGSWTIPKGEFVDEDPKEAAKREFLEETGYLINNELEYLKETKTKSGKVIFCWTAEDNLNPRDLKSNTFELEWPPRSGKKQVYPEIDKGDWFSIPMAKEKIHPDQLLFIESLINKLNLPYDKVMPKNDENKIITDKFGQTKLF